MAPALFLSHGAPLLAIEDSAARRYLTEMGGHIRQPRAIVIMSAHHHAQNAPNRVEVVTDPGPATVHDFGGFPDALYAITYPASGAPDLGTEICEQLTEAGFDAAANPDRGFDHGIWVPLMLMYPQADVPVVQIAINMAEDPHWHFRVGAALAPLRESNVLIVGSGSATHNL
ncbi:MAG: class III extradiol ring-cleavage dioxygenase, partial [Sphingomonadales bacterium]